MCLHQPSGSGVIVSLVSSEFRCQMSVTCSRWAWYPPSHPDLVLERPLLPLTRCWFPQFSTSFILGSLRMGSMSYSIIDTQGHSVTESEVQLFTAQKPLKRSDWWKWKFALFGCWQSVGKVDSCPRLTQPPDSQGARAFIGWGRGLHAESVWSALMVILKSVIGVLTSIIPIVLGTVISSSHFLEANS